jgi:hypothetical protein
MILVLVDLPPFESKIFDPNLAPPPNTVFIAFAAFAAIVFYAVPIGFSTSTSAIYVQNILI